MMRIKKIRFIDEVKDQLIKAENASRSVLSIAFDAGFNSKATFNRIFKERVNQSRDVSLHG